MFSGAGTLRFSSCSRGRASAAPRRRIPSVPAAVFPLPPPGGSPPPAKGCSSSDPCRGIGEAADPQRPAPEAGIFRRPQYTRFLQLLKQQRRPHFPLSAAAPVSGLIFPCFAGKRLPPLRPGPFLGKRSHPGRISPGCKREGQAGHRPGRGSCLVRLPCPCRIPQGARLPVGRLPRVADRKKSCPASAEQPS